MLWLLVPFIAYWIALEVLRVKGILEKYGMKNYGPILLFRTQRGLETVEKLARVKNFWRIFANIGIPALFLGMAFMFFLIILADIIMLISPPQPSELTSPQAALLIPGINPFIPLLWGFIGLVVAIIVHEFSHAILCRVEGIKVKSLGLIFALFPIGAFAEPDEKELLDKRVSKISRIRIYSAGITGNFFVAFFAFFLFLNILPTLNPTIAVVDDSGKLIGKVLEVNGNRAEDITSLVKEREWNYMILENSTGRHNVSFFGVFGVKIVGLYRNGVFPAELAGIEKGMVITGIDGKKIQNILEFREEMAKKRAGEEILLEVYDPKINDFRIFKLKLVEQSGRAFMGVYVSNFDCVGGINFINSRKLISALEEIPSHLKNPFGWILIISMPFTFQGFSGIETYFENSIYVFWILNSLYWIAWINFYVALFNCLPAIPLDGGRVFQETISWLLRRMGEKGERISSEISKALAIFIFFSIILMILIPNLRI
ncbi:MAG: site-2 protease family protein [Archaeoglobaceae archaeon]